MCVCVCVDRSRNVFRSASPIPVRTAQLSSSFTVCFLFVPVRNIQFFFRRVQCSHAQIPPQQRANTKSRHLKIRSSVICGKMFTFHVRLSIGSPSLVLIFTGTGNMLETLLRDKNKFGEFTLNFDVERSVVYKICMFGSDSSRKKVIRLEHSDLRDSDDITDTQGPWARVINTSAVLFCAHSSATSIYQPIVYIFLKVRKIFYVFLEWIRSF